MRYSHGISDGRMQQMLSEVFGLEISQGGIANLMSRVKDQLQSEVDRILAAFRRARLVCSDETSDRVNGKNQWEWVFQNEHMCFHIIRASRGGDGIQAVMADHRHRCRLYRDLKEVLALTPTQEDGIRLQTRYRALQENLFLFLDDSTIPPTNNSSEQALRWSVIFRKVTNGFRSDWGRDLFAAVRSIVNTGKRQGLSAFESILTALNPLESLFPLS